MSASEAYKAGNLAEAIAASLKEVQAAPTNTGARLFLCELLCYAGDLERADRQLDALSKQIPDAAVAVTHFRQIIRSEQARQAFYATGAVPDFLDQPSDILKTHLQASILIREGKSTDAAAILSEAETKRPHPAGICNGVAFDDMRDCDDLNAPYLEVLTTTGKYFWVPMERIESLEFRPPTRPLDLLYRKARLIVRSGPDGEVFIPSLYAGTSSAGSDALKLGRQTDWVGGNGTPVRGLGLRTFLIGEDAKTILEIESITIGQQD